MKGRKVKCQLHTWSESSMVNLSPLQRLHPSSTLLDSDRTGTSVSNAIPRLSVAGARGAGTQLDEKKHEKKKRVKKQRPTMKMSQGSKNASIYYHQVLLMNLLIRIWVREYRHGVFQCFFRDLKNLNYCFSILILAMQIDR